MEFHQPLFLGKSVTYVIYATSAVFEGAMQL